MSYPVISHLYVLGATPQTAMVEYVRHLRRQVMPDVRLTPYVRRWSQVQAEAEVRNLLRRVMFSKGA